MLKYLPTVILEYIARLTMRVQMELARRERIVYKKERIEYLSIHS